MSRSTSVAGALAVGALAGVVAVAGVAALVGLNPVAAPPSAVRAAEGDAQELLADPLLALAPGPWVAESPGGLVPSRRGWARVRGVVRQEVALTALPGRPYRFTVRLRAAGAGGRPGVGDAAGGAVQVQTACSGAGEVARTVFRVGATWQDVPATLTAATPEGCSMRVLLEAADGPGIEVAGTSLRVGVLADPSFEAAPAGPGGTAPGGTGSGPWTAEGLTVSPVTDAGPVAGPVDGARALRVVAGPGGGVLRQVVRLDPSSEPVLARAEVWVQAVGPSAVPVGLRVGRPCPSRPDGGDATAPAGSAQATVAPGAGWRRLVAEQRVAPPGTDGRSPEPPVIIRPDGVGCTVTFEVRLPAGVTVLVDGADLRLVSLHPPAGSDRYRRELDEPVTGPTTPIDQRMGGSVDGASSAGGS